MTILSKTEFIRDYARAVITKIEHLNDGDTAMVSEIQKDIDTIAIEMSNPTLSSLSKLSKIGHYAGFNTSAIKQQLR